MKNSALALGWFLLISQLSLKFWYFCGGFLLLSACQESRFLNKRVVTGAFNGCDLHVRHPSTMSLCSIWALISRLFSFTSHFTFTFYCGSISWRCSCFTHDGGENNLTVQSERQTLYTGDTFKHLIQFSSHKDFRDLRFQIGGGGYHTEPLKSLPTGETPEALNGLRKFPPLERVQSGLLPLMNENTAMIYPIMPELWNLWPQDVNRTFVSSSQILRKMDNSVFSMGQFLLIAQVSLKCSFWIYFVFLTLLLNAKVCS